MNKNNIEKTTLKELILRLLTLKYENLNRYALAFNKSTGTLHGMLKTKKHTISFRNAINIMSNLDEKIIMQTSIGTFEIIKENGEDEK